MNQAAHPSPPLESECALLVLSCDAYADLWPPFFTLLDRYWPDCPFPVYLGTESGFAPAGIRGLASAKGRQWSHRLCDHLDELPQTHVLVMLEDFFLRDRVPTARVIEALRFAQNQKATQVRLIPRPKPTDRIAGQNHIGISAPGTPYRLSTQAAIWDRKQLRSLLRENESIWEFEINGNQRANALPTGFYTVWQPALPYEGRWAHHVVEKGRWLPHEKWIFERQDIGCDFSRRGSLSWSYTFFYQSVQWTNHLLGFLPLPVSQRIKTSLKTGFRPLLAGQFSRLRNAPSATANHGRR